MSFTNLYYKRTAGTPKACYVCFRPTATVLATANSIDFLYTCDSHLSDPGFASRVGETGDGAIGARKLGLSDEEIQKIKEEWEEKQKRKRKKEKEKGKEKEKEKAEDDAKDNDEAKDTKDADKPQEKKTSPSPAASTPSTATHQRYTLHREIFAMRLALHRKRRQAAQAKEVAPRLPTAPRTGI